MPESVDDARGVHPSLDARVLRSLPGSEVVLPGLADLARGEVSAEALLVAIGASRLRRAGLAVPEVTHPAGDAEVALYQQLRTTHPTDAYGRYNGLVRRLVRFEQALEQAAARASRRGSFP